MKRFLALLVAAAMIAGAFVVRARIDDDGDTDAAAPDRDVRLVCASELAVACADLGGTVEDTRTTIDRLVTVDGDPGLDSWLTLDPLPEVVDLLRQQAGRERLFDEEPPLVAGTAIAAVGTGLDGCDWRCLGDRGARLGLPDPRGGTGLLVIGAATAGFFGGDDVATNDFTPEFDAWIRSFTTPTRVDADPVRTRLLSAAFIDVALDLQVEAETELAGADPDRRGDLAVTYPEPVTHAFAVLAVRRGTPDELRTPARPALVDRGWTDPSALPSGSSGLPSAGVLAALRERVR